MTISPQAIAFEYHRIVVGGVVRMRNYVESLEGVFVVSQIEKFAFEIETWKWNRHIHREFVCIEQHVTI